MLFRKAPQLWNFSNTRVRQIRRTTMGTTRNCGRDTRVVRDGLLLFYILSCFNNCLTSVRAQIKKEIDMSMVLFGLKAGTALGKGVGTLVGGPYGGMIGAGVGALLGAGLGGGATFLSLQHEEKKAKKLAEKQGYKVLK
jgi:hypothetical protein